MKKLLACILVIAMLASLAACGKKEETPSNANNETTKAAEPTKAETTPEPTATTAPTATPEPTATPTPEPTATPDPALVISDVKVTVPDGQPEILEGNDDDDISDLVGSWYEQDALFPRNLVVNEDGSIELRFQGGGAMYGNVVAQSENGVAPFYIFSDTDGDFIASAQKDNVADGIIVLSTLEDGELTFVRDSESASTVDITAMFGTWIEETRETGWQIVVSADGWEAYRDGEQLEGDFALRDTFVILRQFDGNYWTNLSFEAGADGSVRVFASDLGENGVWFRKYTAEDEYPEYVPGDDYCGLYQCDRASMQVMREGAGAFIFDIIWANSAEEWVEWNYWTFYSEEDDAFHSDGGSVKWLCTYNAETGEEEKEVLSTDEKADFSPYENYMFWIDQTGDIEGEMQFEKMP